MDLRTISSTWCRLNENSRIGIVTESHRLNIAELIKTGNDKLVSEVMIYNIEVDEYSEQIKSLSEDDLLIALFTIDGYMNRDYRNNFPVFSKPLGIKSKYVFIRLDIPEEALLTGLNAYFSYK